MIYHGEWRKRRFSKQLEGRRFFPPWLGLRVSAGELSSGTFEVASLEDWRAYFAFTIVEYSGILGPGGGAVLSDFEAFFAKTAVDSR